MSPLGCKLLAAGPRLTHFHLLLVKAGQALDTTVVVECVSGTVLGCGWGGHPVTPAPRFSWGTYGPSALKPLGKNPEVLK